MVNGKLPRTEQTHGYNSQVPGQSVADHLALEIKLRRDLEFDPISEDASSKIGSNSKSRLSLISSARWSAALCPGT